MIGVWTPPEGAELLLKTSVFGDQVPAGSKQGRAVRYKDGRGIWRVKIIYDKKGNEQAQVIVTDSNNRKLEKRAKVIQAEVLEAARIMGFTMPDPEVPVAITCTFYKCRPKSHYGSGRNAEVLKDAAPAFPLHAPDVTKLWRGFEDALTGVLWHDDSRVVAQPIFEEYIERWEEPCSAFSYYSLPATVGALRLSGHNQEQESLLA